MMIRICSLVFLALLFLPDSSEAQRRRKRDELFRAGAIVGLNIAQIEGDRQQGFHKPGLMVGLRGSVVLKPRLELAVELLFSQKGSRPSDEEKTLLSNPVDVSINYAEIPVMIRYLTGADLEGEYGLQLATGLAFGRLTSATIEPGARRVRPFNFDPLEEDLRSSAFSWLGDIVWLPIPQLGFGIRAQIDLVPIYRLETDDPELFKRFTSYVINLHAAYQIR